MLFFFNHGGLNLEIQNWYNVSKCVKNNIIVYVIKLNSASLKYRYSFNDFSTTTRFVLKLFTL